ncbi:tetraspanin [Elysia marginata]|uniref:Tetraspanin n=1 Tax=Elysia marginata TaxID=1093978 RepID=A0AAV4HUH4_9GAST|nr:tetraspanin [Elysia marginata]
MQGTFKSTSAKEKYLSLVLSDTLATLMAAIGALYLKLFDHTRLCPKKRVFQAAESQTVPAVSQENYVRGYLIKKTGPLLCPKTRDSLRLPVCESKTTDKKRYQPSGVNLTRLDNSGEGPQHKSEEQLKCPGRRSADILTSSGGYVVAEGLHLPSVLALSAWLVGCAVLTVAIWVWASRGTSMAVIPTYSFLTSSSLGIIAGVLILGIGFLGCLGAFFENQCLLIGYFVLVLFVFALEVTAGTLGFVYKDRAREIVREELAGGMRHDYLTIAQLEAQNSSGTYYDPDAQGWSTSLDSMQKDLRCCGADNYTDWYDVRAWPGERRVPDSCCLKPEPGCGAAGNVAQWHQRGCIDEMDYWLTKHMYIMGVTGVAVASIQILAMVAAIAQFCYIRSKRFPL